MSGIGKTRGVRLPSGRTLQFVVAAVIVSILIGMAFVAQGFDVKKVNLTNHNIWALQKHNPNPKAQASGRYARINTKVNEIGLTSDVNIASQILQTSNGSILFNQKAAFVNISSTQPAAFLDDSQDAIDISSAPKSIEMDDSKVVLVDTSRVLKVSVFDGIKFPAPSVIPNPQGVSKEFGFDAVTISATGEIVAFSATDGSIRSYDSTKQAWSTSVDKVQGADSGNYQLAVVSGKWALLNIDASKLWIQGGDSAISVAANSYLQKSSDSESLIYVSALTGLQTVNPADRKVVLAKTVSGALETARPIDFGGVIYSSWLSDTQGWFYASNTGELKDLPFNGQTLDPKELQKSTDDLVLVSNGESAIINETYSGWAWSLPNGELVSGSQNWDGTPPVNTHCDTTVPGSCKNPQQPPRPVDDNFGVRSGELVSLPVLINDSDTNAGDIISIIPESVKGLDPNFGTVRTTSGEQMLAVSVNSNASGTASFRYQISDGISKPSKSAKVTLHVVGAGRNSAPGWCTDVVPTCIQQLPNVSVAPGSDVTIPFLDGWVDPDGDRFFISSAKITSGEGNLAYSASGDVVYQNENANSKKSATVSVRVVVSDVHGATATKNFDITVAPSASATVSVPVLVGTTAEPLNVDFADYVSGASGSISIASLLAADSNKNDGLQIEQVDSTRVKLSSNKAGSAILNLTLNDSDKKKLTSVVKVNFEDPQTPVLATSPVTVLVSPGLDTSLNLFTAAINAAGRSLAISSLEANPAAGATINADKIKSGYVRIRGRTKTDTPGFVGVVNYKISDGSGTDSYTADGQAFVYEMPDPESKAPVARRDSVVVRAGAPAEVDVLSNDLGDPGVPLMIDSKSVKQDPKASCLEGGLIFAGGGKIRLVAPSTPGLYTCGYSIYPVSNPLLKSLATLTIRVIAKDGSNQVPVPVNLYARVRAGETVNIPVPTVGVDPDGDAVLVKALSGIKGQMGAAYINPDGTSLEYSAVAGVHGQDTFNYTLVDSNNGISQPAQVHVAIIDSTPETAPATMNDYAEVRVGANNKVVLDPVSNDYDPQPSVTNPISLVKGSLLPDALPGSDNYKLWASRVSVRKNKVTIMAGLQPGTMHFVYRAKGSTGSEAIGNITVKVTDSAVDDAPDITDTFVSQADQTNKLTTTGIDVISNKVLWASGDPSTLTLSIWGGLSGFKAISNSLITSATIPQDAGIVIFKLSGTNFYGKEVESYGFMHLPGANPKITFDPSKALVHVKENETASFDIAGANQLNLPGGLTIGKVSAHGLRQNAQCRVRGGTVIEYVAGSGGPWLDFCDVSVKISGSTEDFTTIMVPIRVTPANPEPVLLGRQLTVIPGDSNFQTLNLQSMTTWELNQNNLDGLQYQIDGGTDLFRFDKSGPGNSVIKITAFGSSPAGSIRRIKISIANHPKTEPVYLVLVVGQPPNNLPVGSTLTLDCNVNDSLSSCVETAAQMNAGPGVYNAYQEALTFAPFGYSTGEVNYAAGSDVTCGDVKLRASADAITARWSQANGSKAAGSKCSITYHVLDHDHRLGSGTLEFNFKGVPGPIGSVTQVAYSASTITIQISPPKTAYPEVDNFEVSQDGGDAFNCPIDLGAAITRCVIRNLQPYDGVNKANLHSYSVRASNSVGVSNVPRVLDGAYAFRSPKALTSNNIRAVTKYSPAASASVGFAEVTIYPVADPSVKSYSISSDVTGSLVEKTVTDNTTPFTVMVSAKPGFSSAIHVSATGVVKPPVGSIADSGSSATWVGRIAAVPKIDSVSARVISAGNGWASKLTVSGANRNYSNKAVKVAFIMYPGSTAPTCNWDSGTNNITIGGPGATDALFDIHPFDPSDQQIEDLNSQALSPIQDNTTYTPMVCYVNGYGKTVAYGHTISTLSDPVDGAYTYDISPNPVNGAWLVSLANHATASGVYPQFNGSKTDPNDWRNDIYSTYYGEEPIIKVRYCKIGSTTNCSDGNRIVTPVSSARSWQLKIDGIDTLLDTSGSNPTPTTVCSPSLLIDVRLLGLGLTAGDTRLWQISDAQYLTSTGVTGDLEKADATNWQLPSRRYGNVTKITFNLQGNNSNSTRHVQGLTGKVSLDFTCH